MPLTTPRFWYQRRRGWQAWLLWPLGWLYGCAVTLHRRSTRRWRCSVPVLSIGNLTLGGTGKTPLGIALAQGLEERGRFRGPRAVHVARQFEEHRHRFGGAEVLVHRGFEARGMGLLPVDREHV